MKKQRALPNLRCTQTRVTRARRLAHQLMESLPSGMEGLFNPYRDKCKYDSPTNGPEQRLERLALHLNCKPKLILIGEAPGYQGCRYSGVAFTSERLICEGVIPRISSGSRLTMRARPFSEPSATIVWDALYRLGLADQTILWNAVQLHPYKQENPWSNRTPLDSEVAMGISGLRSLIEAFPTAKIVAVGKKAEKLLMLANIQTIGSVRHPANGGATKFAAGLKTMREILNGR